MERRQVLKYVLALGLPVGLAACTPPDASTTGQLTFLQAPLAPQGLVGATPNVLNAEFGQPALLRVDGAAQVWLYHSSACGLNLILYPDATGTPRVAMAAPTADSTQPASCTTSLQRAHMAAATTAALERPASS